MSIILIVAQTFLGVIGLLKDSIFTSEVARKILLVLILVLMFAVLVFQIIIQTREDFKNQYDGLLTSPTRSDTTTPAFEFGGTTLNWTGDSTIPQIQLVNGDFIHITMINGKVNLTTQIRDNEGHLIGDIVNNHWRIYSTQFILDRNFNSNSLEIKNLQGDLTFQVQLNGNAVKLAGYYYTKGGNAEIQFVGPWIKDSNPLFLYPSIENRHKLNPAGTYSTTPATFQFSR